MSSEVGAHLVFGSRLPSSVQWVTANMYATANEHTCSPAVLYKHARPDFSFGL